MTHSNDIQFIYYEKTIGINESTGDKLNSQSIKIHDDLIETAYIVTSNHYLQMIDDNNPKNTRSNFNFIYESGNNRFEILTKAKIKNYSRNIGEQIAFLLMQINAGYTNDNTEGTINFRHLVNNLINLKEKRNQMYLIHGDENSTSFFSTSEAEMKSIEFQDYAQLFEIIYFLLKATYIKIPIN